MMRSRSTRRPTRIYINGINSNGLWFPEPHKLTWNAKQSWWEDGEGDYVTKELGTDNYSSLYISFCSASRTEVALWTEAIRGMLTKPTAWTAGIVAATTMLNSMLGVDAPENQKAMILALWNA